MSYSVAHRPNEIESAWPRPPHGAGEAAILIPSGLAIGLAATLGTTRFVERFFRRIK